MAVSNITQRLDALCQNKSANVLYFSEYKVNRIIRHSINKQIYCEIYYANLLRNNMVCLQKLLWPRMDERQSWKLDKCSFHT